MTPHTQSFSCADAAPNPPVLLHVGMGGWLVLADQAIETLARCVTLDDVQQAFGSARHLAEAVFGYPISGGYANKAVIRLIGRLLGHPLGASLAAEAIALASCAQQLVPPSVIEALLDSAFQARYTWAPLSQVERHDRAFELSQLRPRDRGPTLLGWWDDRHGNVRDGLAGVNCWGFNPIERLELDRSCAPDRIGAPGQQQAADAVRVDSDGPVPEFRLSEELRELIASPYDDASLALAVATGDPRHDWCRIGRLLRRAADDTVDWLHSTMPVCLLRAVLLCDLGDVPTFGAIAREATLDDVVLALDGTMTGFESNSTEPAAFTVRCPKLHGTTRLNALDALVRVGSPDVGGFARREIAWWANEPGSRMCRMRLLSLCAGMIAADDPDAAVMAAIALVASGRQGYLESALRPTIIRCSAPVLNEVRRSSDPAVARAGYEETGRRRSSMGFVSTSEPDGLAREWSAGELGWTPADMAFLKRHFPWWAAELAGVAGVDRPSWPFASSRTSRTPQRVRDHGRVPVFVDWFANGLIGMPGWTCRALISESDVASNAKYMGNCTLQLSGHDPMSGVLLRLAAPDGSCFNAWVKHDRAPHNEAGGRWEVDEIKGRFNDRDVPDGLREAIELTVRFGRPLPAVMSDPADPPERPRKLRRTIGGGVRTTRQKLSQPGRRRGYLTAHV